MVYKDDIGRAGVMMQPAADSLTRASLPCSFLSNLKRDFKVLSVILCIEPRIMRN
jgi:hypothetical protein